MPSSSPLKKPKSLRMAAALLPLSAIAQDLKPGCVLLDMSDVKAQVMAWAAELLPDTVHFVGGHPILVVESLEPAAAQADLSQKRGERNCRPHRLLAAIGTLQRP